MLWGKIVSDLKFDQWKCSTKTSIYIFGPSAFTFKKCTVYTHDTLYTVAINFLDMEYVGVNLLSRFIFSKVYRYPESDRVRNSYLIGCCIFPISSIKRWQGMTFDIALKLILPRYRLCATITRIVKYQINFALLIIVMFDWSKALRQARVYRGLFNFTFLFIFSRKLELSIRVIVSRNNFQWKKNLQIFF